MREVFALWIRERHSAILSALKMDGIAFFIAKKPFVECRHAIVSKERRTWIRLIPAAAKSACVFLIAVAVGPIGAYAVTTVVVLCCLQAPTMA